MFLDDDLDAMPRRALAEMELWEQRLKNITKRWAGWSVRENKGRVLVAHRPKAGMSEQVLLPIELTHARQQRRTDHLGHGKDEEEGLEGDGQTRHRCFAELSNVPKVHQRVDGL